MCIYNVVVLGSLGIIFTLTTTQPPHVNFLIQSVIVFAATTLTQCFIFVPKVLLLRTFSIAFFVFCLFVYYYCCCNDDEEKEETARL